MTRLFNVMAIEIAPVLDTFGVRVAAIFVRDTAFANRPALIIKADNSRRKLGKSLFGFCIKGDEGDDVPMIHEFIGGIVVHGPIGYKIADAKVRIKFSDLRHGKNGKDAVMP